MEMSFLLFIGFASRAKQGHPEQKENNGANGILKLVNKNLTLQFTLKILIGEMVTFTSRQRGFVLEELI